jgi:hypothetical protein
MLSWPRLEDDRFFDQQFYVVESKVQELILSILSRDKYRCNTCKFQSRPSKQVVNGFMQVRAKDGNYSNLKSSNLETICPFCHAEQNLRFSIISKKFRLIMSDCVTQLQISIISKPIFNAKLNPQHTHFEAAEKLYKELISLDSPISLEFPIPATYQNKIDNIRLFCTCIVNIDDGTNLARREWYARTLRLMPDFEYFTELTKYWQAAVFQNIDEQEWYVP